MKTTTADEAVFSASRRAAPDVGRMAGAASGLVSTLVSAPVSALVAVPAALATAAADPALALRRLVVPLPRGPLVIENWHIARGEKVAVIGSNGVGKTSLTEALLGLRENATVEAQLLGFDIAQWRRRPELRKRLGVQLQRVAFPGRPRVRELVNMHEALFDSTSPAVMEALGVPPLMQRLYEYLSRGETQRIDLFLALAHEPDVLFLDEPFTGLDPQFARSLSALLGGMRKTTLVMCCHTAEELALVDKVAWLTPGGIARFDKPDVLRRQLVGDYRLGVQCDDEPLAQQLSAELDANGRSGWHISVDGAKLVLVGPEPLADLARVLADRPGVQTVESGRSSLSDLLRHCAKREAECCAA